MSRRDYIAESDMTEAQRARAARKRAKRAARQPVAPTDSSCVECAGAPELVGGEAVYPHRSEWFERRYWRCACGAYVGCHPGTETPLGRPAGPETRAARGEAHAAFDALWKRKAVREEIPAGKARGIGYAWLAAQLGIEPSQCHIGWMTADQARRVVEICAPFARRGGTRCRTYQPQP